MNCINCHKPHNNQFTLVMGMFKVCNQCETTGNKLAQSLDQGLDVEFVDPKTGSTYKQTFRTN